jgi:hypothetical protein
MQNYVKNKECNVKNVKAVSIGSFIAIGVGVGAAFGAALNSLGLGIALGVAIGAAIGGGVAASQQTQENDDAEAGKPDGGE